MQIDDIPLLAHLPVPAQKRIALHLTPTAEQAIRQGHPWLFAEGVRQQSHLGEPGDLAVLFDQKRRFLAIGLYDPTSPILVRVLQTKEQTPIHADWFQAKLTTALTQRAGLLATQTNGYRLIHGENDGLPGLVVDRYDQLLVIKLYTSAWFKWLKTIIPLLLALQPAQHLVLRLNRSLQNSPHWLYGLHDGQLIYGESCPQPTIFEENGLRFEADPFYGQKTGFFLDQRENRARLEQLSSGKRVLNLFAYTGGFSVYAARGGAKSVVSVDINPHALAAAERNFALNQHIPSVVQAKHTVCQGDAFALLAEWGKEGRLFELVVLDPPAFAKSQAEVPASLNAYRRLAKLGATLVKSGGVLLASSCSSRVSAEQFFQMVAEGVKSAGKSSHPFQQSFHPIDHPIRFAQGAYLKTLYTTIQD